MRIAATRKPASSMRCRMAPVCPDETASGLMIANVCSMRSCLSAGVPRRPESPPRGPSSS